MGIDIREASTQDIDGIADGFARATHRADRRGHAPPSLRNRVAWSLESNPAGVSSLVAIDSRGVVVGHLGASHVPMLLRGERRCFGRRFASFIDDEYRMGGVHALPHELDSEFAERFEGKDAIAVLFGLVIEPDFWWLRKLRDHIALRTCVELTRPASPYEGRRSAGLDVLPGTADVLEPWSVPIAPGECAVYRDGVLQAFRASGPYSSDESWCAVRDGDVVGSAIVRQSHGERHLLDWAIAPGDEEIPAALLTAVIGDGLQPVRTRLFSGCRATTRYLQAHGFRVGPGTESYLSVRISAPGIVPTWLGRHWTATPADCGLEPMGPLSSGEAIVDPPPAGTRSGRERAGRARARPARAAEEVAAAPGPVSASASAAVSAAAASASASASASAAASAAAAAATPDPVSGGAVAGDGLLRRSWRRVRETVTRSTFPIVALFIIGSAVVVGPWVSLVLAYTCWRIAGRIG